MLLISVVCVVGAGTVGGLLLRLVRGRSLTHSLLVAAIMPVIGVTAAVLLRVRQMFISAHDSRVTLITVATSALFSAFVSIWLGRRAAGESRLLGEQLLTLGETGDEAGVEAEGRVSRLSRQRTGRAPAELTELATQLAATRARLEESRRRELALEASRRELVAFMSHDLRTPLAGLRALAEGLEYGVIDDTELALARMRQTVDRMNGLVDDLFELSRLSSGAPSRPLMWVSVAELVDDVSALLDDLARSRDVTIVVDAPGDDRLRVMGDSDELARALTNLLANGVRHTPADGQVRLLAERADDGRVHCAVVDGCGGIAEGELPKLFEVGWRGSADRTPDDGGAGLGLAIARGVVEAHAGTIAVANVPGGCRFEVALPAGQPA